jgi:hypothetical protein
VAVNPDRGLLRIARDRNWEVRRFVRPVRLRDRVNMPRPAATAAAGGGLATLVAAGAVWWWLRRQPPAQVVVPDHRERLALRLRAIVA